MLVLTSSSLLLPSCSWLSEEVTYRKGVHAFDKGNNDLAYAEAGDFDNAVKWENQYLATPDLNAKATAEAKSRLALYQAHQPYHETK